MTGFIIQCKHSIRNNVHEETMQTCDNQTEVVYNTRHNIIYLDVSLKMMQHYNDVIVKRSTRNVY